MRYMIAKVNKDQDIFGSLFGGSRNNVEFGEDFYETVQDAEMAVEEFIKPLNDIADKAWNKMSDSEHLKNNKQFDEGAVYQRERYIIVPVEKVIDITSVPKHRRK